MRVHELKTWPEKFEAVCNGTKTAEFRNMQGRDFRIGDIITLREYCPHNRCHTGREQRVTITHIQTGFGIPEGFGMLSFRLERKP